MSGKSAANGEANCLSCWVELYGAVGQLRLLRKDWAALILIAYDAGWEPTQSPARLFMLAARELATDRDREHATRLAQQDFDEMTTDWTASLPSRVVPRLDDMEAAAFADALEVEPFPSSSRRARDDSMLDLDPEAGPYHRLQIDMWPEKPFVDWVDAERPRKVAELVRFCRLGGFEVWNWPSDLLDGADDRTPSQ